MEPEDLPWPGELEEEEEEEEEEKEEEATAAAAEAAAAANLDDVVVVEEVQEEAGRELDSDSHYGHQHLESTDDGEDEEDEEAKAWLQAHPGRILPLPSPLRHRYSEGERTSLEKIVPLTCHVWQQILYQGNSRTQISDTNVVCLETTAQQGSGDDQKTESWHCLPQEMDPSQTLDTSQTRFNVRREDTEVSDFPSLEEGVLTQSENQVKEPNRDLFCSPLLVIQDSFASPDLPLLTCLTQDQEFASDSLFHQSELSFAPLRGIPDKSEDTEWSSRPSEVSEALFQATAEVASDLASSCFSVSQHPLIGSTTVGSQCPFLPSEQGNNEETISSVDELKIPKDCDSYDDLCSYMSWKTRKDTQQPETNLADKDQVSVTSLSDITDENIATERSDHFDAAYSYGQYWKQEASPKQTETYLTKGLQGKAESDIITLDGLNENAVVCSERITELQRKVGHSNLGINESFSFLLPSFVPHKLTRESEYHSSDLRMLRMSPDTVPKAPKHLKAGDASKGGIAKVTQSNLKSGITTTPVDSDIGSHLSLSLEDLSQLTLSSPLETTTGQHTSTLNQRPLADTHLTEETLKVTAIPEPAYQKTATPTVLSSSHSHRGKPSILYQQGLPDSHLTEEALKVLAAPGPTDETTGIPTLTSTSYSHREKPGIFYQQELPESNLTEEPLKVSAAPGPVEQKTGIPTVSSTSHSHGEDLLFFYRQTLPDGHLTDQALKVSAMSGPADQKTGTATVLSTPYSHREKPGIFYQQEFPDSHQTKETLKVSFTPGLADQKTEIPAVQSSSYSQREKPSILSSQVLADSRLPEEGLNVSAVAGPADQKTGLPTVPSNAYSHREKLRIFYQQALLDSQLPEEVLKNSAVSGPADRKTGTPTVTSTSSVSSSLGEKPGAFYQQTLPNSHLTEEALKVSVVPGPGDQKTGIPSAPSSFYSHREKPVIFSQQTLPDFLFPEEALKVSAVSVLAAQKTGTPTVSSNSHSHNEKSSIFYQQELPDSDLPRESLKMSAIPGLTDQKTVPTPTVPSGSFSHREKPSIFYQQELPDSHPTEKAVKVSTGPGPADQKTEMPTIQSSSYPQREKPSVFYPQVLSDSRLPEESLKVSAFPGPADQTTDTPAVPSTFYSQREKPGIFYQQTLPESHLPKEALKISVAPGPADQRTGTPTVTSTSYSQYREKPSIFHQQALPGTHIPEEAQKVSAVTGLGDQKTWIPGVLSTFYSQREKPGIFYQQTLPGSHIPEEAQKGSTVPGPADQKTGTPTPTSTSYSHTEKPGIFYQQVLPDNHPTEEALKISVAYEPVDQTTGTPTATSTSYSQHREKPSIFYQQSLPSSHLTEEARKVSVVPGPADQKTGIPTLPSTFYSYTEKPGVFYQQVLPDNHPTEEALKISVAYEPVDQTTGTPTATSTSYSQHREKPSIFYQQLLPSSHLTEEARKVSVVPGPADQKTGTPTSTSTFYSHTEKPGVFYQQVLPDNHPTEEALNISVAYEPVDQTTGTPTATSTSYSQHREKPSIFYQQSLPSSHLTEEAKNVSAVPGPADQKTGTPTLPSTFYSHTEKPGVFYQQVLPHSHLPEEALKVSVAPGPVDQTIGTPTVTSPSSSFGEKPIVIYKQAFPDGHLPEESLKVSVAPGPVDQTTGSPTVTSPSYSQHRAKPGSFYQPALLGSQIPEEALRVSSAPGPADQTTGIPTITSTSYSLGEKPIIIYKQAFADGHLPEEALKVSIVSGPTERKTEIPTGPLGSSALGEKPLTFYQQALLDSPLNKEVVKVSAAPGPVDQKTETIPVYSTPYSNRGKAFIFYQQTLSDSHLPEEALKVPPVPGPDAQKTETPSVSSSLYSHREKPVVFYQQALPDSQLTKETLKVSAVPQPADQKTGLSTVTSSFYSHTEKPNTSYQQELPDGHLTEKALKVSDVPGPADQKSGLSTVTSTSYSHREKPIISYQQELPRFTEAGLKILRVPGPADQKTGINVLSSNSYPQREQSVISYQQELPDLTEVTLKAVGVPGPADQKTGIQIASSSSYSNREKPSIFHQQELPDITEETFNVFVVPGQGDQKAEIPTVPLSYYSHREKPSVISQQELPDSHLTEEALKVSPVSIPAEQKTGIPIGPSSSYSHSHKEKLKISTVHIPDDQKTEFPAATLSSYSQTEKPKISTVIGPNDQKTPSQTAFHSSYSQTVKPDILFQQQLPDRDQSKGILKISAVPELTDVNTGKPIPLSSSYFHREKSSIFSPQELPGRHVTEDVLKISTIPGPPSQKTVLPTALPSSFSHREKPDIFYQKDSPDRRLTEDALKISSALGQADQITGLHTVPSGTYSHGENHKLVSEHVQRLIDNLNSSDSSVSSNNVLLNSQADDRVVINKPESAGFRDLGSEEIQDAENSSKTLKEIRTLLMEAENIALKRCNFPAPLAPFRDISDISFIQSKKVVCFKEPSSTDVSNGDLLQRQPFTEESPSSRCIQKDIGTQTNLKCQRGIENWEFISSTTVRSPLQEAESKVSMALEETLRQYQAAKSVMRSEPEGCSGTIGNKIIIPMMTVIKSDSSSDASDGNGSCSWDSNLPESLESVSDVLLNFFPYVSPKTSITDSREEEGVSESEDGGGSSVDSLAAHVKNLLQCESSLNHAKEILRNAEEEESRVRAHAWNLKFNLAHDCGYSISELNEDDRRKVEEIKAELFGHGRTTDLSKGLQSPRGMGCKPEAVCSHIIIESHEKGCFRTLTSEQPQLDSHSCAFRSAEPSEMTRGRQSPSSCRAKHVNLSASLDQNNSHFKVWNSLQLKSHSPFQNFIPDEFKISKGLRMPFHEKMNPWLSELVEPAFVPPKKVDFHSSTQMPSPEPVKKFTTSITFSSHRHSKCISNSSVVKVGVTEGSQCTGASVGVFNSHFTEEQNPPRDLKQKSSSPSSFKMHSDSPDKEVTILAEGRRQSQKLSVDFEHSCQEEKPLERSDFTGNHSEPSTSANCSNFKEIQISDNHTLISMGRPSSTLGVGRSSSRLGVKEKNVTVTPDLPSCIFLEQRELFEQSKAPHTDDPVRKHHSPSPQHQDYVAPDLPSCIFLEQRELFEQCRAPYVDHQMRENHSPLPQGQDSIASDLPSPISLEQCQSKAPGVDDQMSKHHFPFPQGQDCVVEKNNQHKPKSHISSINVEAKFNNVVSQSAPNQCTLATSASTPPSNRKALSCVRITLCPKTSSKLDSGTLDKRCHSLDAASKARMNSEFNFDLHTVSSRSLEPTSKLLTSKPVVQDQESLGFLGPKSSLDFRVVQPSLPDSNTITQDLKTIPSQNSQIVTSRQIQVNISDFEGHSNPEGTPVSADRLPKKIKTPLSAFSEKLSSDAVTQITTESPEKTLFSSEIFINAEDRGHEITEPGNQKLRKAPVKFASSSSVQQVTFSRGTDGQPLLLPYKPSGSTKMYYVPQLRQIPPSPDSKSDTTVESSHSDASVQVLITGDENLSDKKQKEIHSTRAVTEAAQAKEKESLQKDTADSSAAAAAEHSAQVGDPEIKNSPDTKAITRKEEIHRKRTVPEEAWTSNKESLQINIEESECHSEFENTTHSVFRSAKFYIHHPVHLPSDQDICHESLGRSVFMRHSWKDFFQHHPDKQREHICLPLPYQNMDKTKTDYTRIKSLSINVNLGNKEVTDTTKSQARDYPEYSGQINDPKRDQKVTPEQTTQHTVSLNELWNKYRERQRQQRQPELGDRKELSLVDRLDRLAKILQNPITHSLQVSESTHDDSRGERDVKEWSGRQQQRNKLQKKKRFKSLEKSHKNTGELKKTKVLSHHGAGRSNQIKIEQIKFDKYILSKQPGFNYISNTSSDCRPSEESELLTDTATNILSSTTSTVESDILTQTDREVALHERSSSVSTIDTARLIQAFGHERVCLSPRRIKLYSSITNQQRRYLEKRSKHSKKVLNTGHPLVTSEHTRRRRIQVANHVISSDSISSSASSFLNSNSTFCNKQNAHMLNKGIQAGNLEIVNGAKKHTRDVGITFPTPSSSEAKLEEDSDVTSWSEEKLLFTSYPGDRKLKKNKKNSHEGVSWFVPVENVESGSKKENVPKTWGPGVSWFEPITKTKPWREPLREQNWQGQHLDGRGSLAGPGREDGRDPLKPFVRATLQESLQFHRPDFISSSGERIKRLKLIVQERKLQSMLQSERDVLFNIDRERQGHQNRMRPLPKRVFLAVQKSKPISKKEMIQRSKRIYEQLPEVQKKREEEKRKSEYKSYRLRAQLYKKRVTNQLLGRKVPWD
ncbi:centrosome-associated protein ALMS1 isoform X5 [Macaca thibetana thibetana]|uniref:centrosome-associated protein ALMS1 isoform X5 n=1 Tax=Macaca thibetana thibetana TaxID=257877 RepID=UPI0021BC84B2|nr:centrosome-associated protein ALMS1 isoform X5 [Macaca thibetana thibetana]